MVLGNRFAYFILSFVQVLLVEVDKPSQLGYLKLFLVLDSRFYALYFTFTQKLLIDVDRPFYFCECFYIR